jgi:hypothetical protein
MQRAPAAHGGAAGARRRRSAAAQRGRSSSSVAHERGSAEWLYTLSWLAHINGNALYRLGNEDFTRLVRQTEVRRQ